jgi:hypothetical protein
LLAEGCDWDEDACSSAAVEGHYETLKWLRDNGCPWDVGDVCVRGAQSGSIAILQYALDQGAVWNAEEKTQLLNAAGGCNGLAAAQWLRQQHGAEWPAVLWYETHEGGEHRWYGETLAWARRGGCDSPLTL